MQEFKLVEMHRQSVTVFHYLNDWCGKFSREGLWRQLRRELMSIAFASLIRRKKTSRAGTADQASERFTRFVIDKHQHRYSIKRQ